MGLAERLAEVCKEIAALPDAKRQKISKETRALTSEEDRDAVRSVLSVQGSMSPEELRRECTRLTDAL